MANILGLNKKYSLYDFDSEKEFEEAVIEQAEHLFGVDAIYIDIKRKFGQKDSYLSGIPDGYLLDFFDIKSPTLYFVENELSSHDVYGHITEQLARFYATMISSPAQIRNKLLEVIKADASIQKRIQDKFSLTTFSNIDELMIYVTEKSQMKIVVAINEIEADLNLGLNIFKSKPDTVLLQRYRHENELMYYYEPMRDEVSVLEDEEEPVRESFQRSEFDTVVCAAFPEGFQHAYVENNAWWAIRLSQQAREKIKYLAIYEKLPIASISNIAEVDRIEPYKDTGKYILYLKNKKKISPIPLDKKKKGEAPQGPRFTTYEKIINAKSVNELWS